ncbi:lipid asymmetry maintenance protein MlaB [Xenorhabdus szentirmaii]|uniref:STAS domain-containing protein n=2 Tax=Xenorhabdus szentirmaii TaxID=290112 RepID=W1IVG9_9GAMM|nr:MULTISPECIES: lipid asymmetry maintenance protein MlaB [Xenorhabdus]MBD2779351.1 lipid asymmetry maintenance protein MlaB [Xenorhabdus sp. 38]MBD2790814.1 lipid asymmetry maintenance protein MlaB [Xenorhabdus sp. CUL]MBD2802868.1 lipid asymmetry maintenance protein MlaB [Xenorhabdus sp. M]MBD2804661.1 lipid asymmetry maintenance protein MlaB [Xenorhabdus sp. ZM]MBD2821999.1 lipid asymmetry maintenance protein MlaB [Xenorhabdus sp. 42]
MEKGRVDSKVADNETVSWEKSGSTLFLKGTLDRDSLLPLWQQKSSALAEVDDINVSQLVHVDSTGVALFVHLKEQQQQSGKTLRFSGVGERLKTLITLYGLQSLLDDHHSVA